MTDTEAGLDETGTAATATADGSRSDAGEVVVALRGEVDHGSLARVRSELERALARLPQVLVVDLASVTFIDSTGLGALVAVRKRLATWSGAMRVVNAPAQAQQLLRLTGLDGPLGL